MAVHKYKANDMGEEFFATDKANDMEEFFAALEKEIKKLGKTIANLCEKCEYKEAQYYRWKQEKGRIPKKAVLRFATALALFENEVKAQKPYNKLPGTDRIDYVINRLLSAAGYPATSGAAENLIWDRVDSDRESWTLGYTDVSGWIWSSDKNWDQPEGDVVDYAELVGRLLGLRTKWKYADSWSTLFGLLRTRAIDAIGPFMIEAPRRLFDCRFAEQCAKDKVHITGLGPKELASLRPKPLSFDKIPRDKNIKVTYIKDEIGHTAAKLLPGVDLIEAANSKEAIGNVKKESKGKNVCIFLSEEMTCKSIAKGDDDVLVIRIPALKQLTAAITFAFHRNEPEFLSATNDAIEILRQSKMYVDTMSKETKESEEARSDE